jgi:hypothetical protein
LDKAATAPPLEAAPQRARSISASHECRARKHAAFKHHTPLLQQLLPPLHPAHMTQAYMKSKASLS